MSTEPTNRAEQLAYRIVRIRLPKCLLARRSTLDPMTISRTLTGKTGPLQSTLDKIECVLIAEEIRLRDHLLKIHPLEAAHDA